MFEIRAPLFSSGSGCIPILVILLIVVILASVIGPNSCSSSPQNGAKSGPAVSSGPVTPPPFNPYPGDEAKISNPENKYMYTAATDDDWNKYNEAERIHDKEGIALMVLRRELTLVPSGTKCRILDSGVYIDQVRILEGDGFGEAVWVDKDFLTPP